MNLFNQVVDYIKNDWFELKFPKKKTKCYCKLYSVDGDFSYKNTNNRLTFMLYYINTNSFSQLGFNSIFLFRRLTKIEDEELLKFLNKKYTHYILQNGIGNNKLEDIFGVENEISKKTS